MRQIIFIAIRKIISFYKIFILRDKFSISAYRWVRDKGDETLRLDYELTEDSVVLDIGGFHGGFSERIQSKYDCNLYIFEPVSEFYDVITKKFESNDKIKTYNFGLSDVNKMINISIDHDASSIYTISNEVQTIQLRSVDEFIHEEGITSIDLMKINIEGGEFDLIPAIISSGSISKVENLQIQFHTFVADSILKRNQIRELLRKTHNVTYEYYFIWENWKIKE